MNKQPTGFAGLSTLKQDHISKEFVMRMEVYFNKKFTSATQLIDHIPLIHKNLLKTSPKDAAEFEKLLFNKSATIAAILKIQFAKVTPGKINAVTPSINPGPTAMKTDYATILTSKEKDFRGKTVTISVKAYHGPNYTMDVPLSKDVKQSDLSVGSIIKIDIQGSVATYNKTIKDSASMMLGKILKADVVGKEVILQVLGDDKKNYVCKFAISPRIKPDNLLDGSTIEMKIIRNEIKGMTTEYISTVKKVKYTPDI